MAAADDDDIAVGTDAADRGVGGFLEGVHGAGDWPRTGKSAM